MDDRAQVAGLQREWMQAWLHGDFARCEEILAPEFRLRSVATDAVIDRAEWLRQARGGRVSGTAFEYEEMAVEVIGDTAVTFSRTAQKASIEGRDWSAVLHITDVWVRRDGAWQVVARHASRPVGHAGAMEA